MGLLIWLLGDVLMVVFASVLCAVVLYGLARILRRHLGVSHAWALSIVVLALLASAALLVWNSGPAIVSEAIRLQDALRQQEMALRGTLQGTPTGQMILNYLPASLWGHVIRGAIVVWPRLAHGLPGP
jgi:predicted PurR-regulated permease PerM